MISTSKKSEFITWLSTNSQLSENSIMKYGGAIKSISNDMLSIHLIYKDLFDMELVELELAIMDILNNPLFIEKNRRGNNMYSNALKHYRHYKKQTEHLFNAEARMITLVQDSTLDETEKETIIKARIGQGKYRDGLLEKYSNRCLITEIDQPQLLVASHIKPWSVSDNTERIDIENGFILSASLDKLFDNGLITFSDLGKMYVSKNISELNQRILNINNPIVVDLKSSSMMIKYLEYHRDILFVD